MDFKSERNKVGVDDMVMLNDITEQAIIDNLKKRYKESLIYTSIGNVLIALNPYKDVNAFSKANIAKYSGKQPFELPPHAFSLADETYRAMLSENENQCIIITGESGAGKTETSKGIMQYISAVSGSSETVNRVKDVILESNPLLESFGNAKTLRNNNSSRFGKYIEIQFNFRGDPVGGLVTVYLLEKSRVISQIPGERNFHIFYQLLAGGSPQEKASWNLTSPNQYAYLNKSNCFTADGINDSKDFSETKHAMQVMGITQDEQSQIFKLLAAILHLGNVTFKAAPQEGSAVVDKGVLNTVASLLGVNAAMLERSLTVRNISSGSGGSRKSTYAVPQKPDQAAFARDALAKGIYSRLFDWIVGRINKVMAVAEKGKTIGILDIYGFEIFEVNSFEQLCINYVNEALHQIFIDLTLKAEQEEYVREGIKWEQINYVNNKPCVELIEGKPFGILSLLDEECLFPEGTDQSYLTKMQKNFASHTHYMKVTGPVANNKFSLQHYAGPVPYVITGFLEKNRDSFFNDLLELCVSSNLSLLTEIFLAGTPGMVVEDKGRGGAKKRPATAGFQFKTSVQALLKALYSCQPHYIRCVKPNDNKQALVFEDKRVTEQGKYLGLLENLRVRRAGYCYRQTYEKWLKRYYMACKKTWPKWNGNAKDGVQAIINEFGMNNTQVQFGKTKIFIREPKTLFDMEAKRLQALNGVAVIIQKTYRAWRARKEYLERKKEALDIYKGQKERNRNSMAPSLTQFYGDFLGAQTIPELRNMFLQNNDGDVVFSDLVNKVNRRFKVQERAIIVTSKAIYNFEKLKKPKKGSLYSFKRRIDLKSVESVSLSKLADNYLVIHVPSEYDYILETAKKTVMITLLSNSYKKLMNRPLKLNFVNSIEFKIKKGQGRQVEFQKDEAAMSAQPKKKGNILNIFIKTGLKDSSN